MLEKKYVLQAKEHVDWVRALCPELNKTTIQPLVVSPENEVDQKAKPHINGLNFVSTSAIAAYGRSVATELQRLRTQFAGKEYGTAKEQLKVELRQAKMDCSYIGKLMSIPLSSIDREI